MTLEALPARTIVAAIAHAAQRWIDADFPPRVRAAQRIAERTGYSAPVVDFALDHLFGGITEQALTSTIVDELGSLDALDRFHQRSGRPPAWARPAGSVCVIASRTTIGVALPPAIFALCAKCDVTVRDREDALCSAFFATLAEERSELAAAAHAAVWGRNGNAVDCKKFDVVVAFGRDETLHEIRNTLQADARFVAFGTRASAGYVSRETLADDETSRRAAFAAARDLVLYETEGCLSLHVLFVEQCENAPSFCDVLAEAQDAMTIEFPVGNHSVSTLAAVAQARAIGVFRKANSYDPPDAPPPFLPRTLCAVPVADPKDAVAYISRHRLALEAFAVSSERSDLVQAACASGAVRIAKLGELQRPPFEGHHGGRPRIADFVRWIDKPA